MLDVDRLARDEWARLYPWRPWDSLTAAERDEWVTHCMWMDERAHVAALRRDLDAFDAA